jgi:hypothetical protein
VVLYGNLGGSNGGAVRMQDSGDGVRGGCAAISAALLASIAARTGLAAETAAAAETASGDFVRLARSAALVGSVSSFALWAALLQRDAGGGSWGGGPAPGGSSSSEESSERTCGASERNATAAAAAVAATGGEGAVAVLPVCDLFFQGDAPWLRPGLLWSDLGGAAAAGAPAAAAAAAAAGALLGSVDIRGAPVQRVLAWLEAGHDEIAARTEAALSL